MKHYHACGLAPYFDGIFISEMLGAAKPSAAYFDAVKAKIGENDPSCYLVIGDSLSSDIAGAEASGMDAVWITKDNTRSEQGHPNVHILHDIRELPDYLHTLQRRNVWNRN